MGRHSQGKFRLLYLITSKSAVSRLLLTMLDKRGNSNSDERLDLLESFESLFPDAEIAYLTADCEFKRSPPQPPTLSTIEPLCHPLRKSSF